MTNEQNVNINPKTGEIATTESNEQFIATLEQSRGNIVSETAEYMVLKDENGKFSRKAKYHPFSSVKSETRADKLWLLNILEGDENSGFGLKDNVGKEIVVQDIIFRPYDRIDETTGQFEYGVLTYLITPERDAYVTSAKSVYFTLKQIMELFGKPGTDDWENITVKVGKQKMTNGDAINIKMIG